MAINQDWGAIGMSTKTGSKIVTPTATIGMSGLPNTSKKVTAIAPPISPSYSAGMSTTKSPTGQVFYTSSGNKVVGYSSPTGNVTAPTIQSPTSYVSGTKVTANTPTINATIPVSSIVSTPSSGTFNAGTSPVLSSYAPSTTYNAVNNNATLGANPITGLYETATTNADGTPKVSATTGTETTQPIQKTQGQTILEQYGIQPLEQSKSITDEYYSSPAYKAQQRAFERVNQTQNAINSVTARLNTDLGNLRGVGAREGVTEAVYGQQTAEIIREANNQLLPLQAQLAADQGNLELATNTLNTWAKLRQDDIENEYNYKKSVRDELVKFATDDQKARLDAAIRKEEADARIKAADVAFQRDIYLKNLTNQAESGGIATLTGKPQNATQAAANSYANRLAESNTVINNLGGLFTGVLAFGNYLPNALQSGDRQAYEQAKSNFVTAILRRESGAAISPTEFSTAEKQYFPQAGDKPSTIAQKEVARNTVINNFYREANVARPVLPGDIIQSGGVRYRVGSDGETITQI